MDNSQARLWLIPLGACALGASVTACADISRLGAYAPGGVDSRSSAAGAVDEAARGAQAYPDLRRLPVAPAAVPAAAYGARAEAQRTARAGLERWVDDNPVEAVDTEAYAGAQRSRVLDPARDAPADDQAARSEAWAARLRELAKPPPPPSL